MSSAAFTTLAPPPMEDSMEMSSPADHTFNDDIDIDIDFGDYPANVTDDERMLEDGDLVRPGTATDAMMADDDQFNTSTAPVNEQEMQDSDVAFQQHDADEELIDYDDEDDFTAQDDARPSFGVAAQQTNESNAFAPAILSSEPAHVDEEVVRLPEDAAVDIPGLPNAPDAEVTTVPPPASASAPASDEAASLEPHTSKLDSAEQTHLEELSGPAQTASVSASTEAPVDGEEGEEAHAEGLGQDHPSDEEHGQKQAPQLAGTLDMSGSFTVDGPPTPTDTGLHPMTIQYGNSAWPVFKSRAQPDGLLKDDNLVSVSFADFLLNCRDRLAKKLVDGLSDDYDLVIGFGTIGLMLVEGTSHASTTSLNEVLEMYKKLCKNDGVHEAPPLRMTLTTQLKFTTHLALLKQAVSEGKGLAEVTGAPIGEAETTDIPYEEEGREEEVGDAGLEQGQEFTEEQEADIDAGSGDTFAQNEDVEYHDEENHKYQDGDEQEQEFNPDDYPEEANYEDYGDHDGHDATEYGDNEDPANEENGADVSQPAHGPDADADDAHTIGHPEHSATRGQDEVAPDSTASSATVRGEAVNISAEAPVEDGEDLLRPSTEDEGQDAQYEGEAQAPDHDEIGDSVAPIEFGDYQEPGRATQGLNADDEPDLGNVDYLNEDFTEYPQNQGDDQADVTEHDYTDAAEDLLQYEEDDPEQATNVDANHEDDQEHEDADGQFHTALDLLDGDDLVEYDEDAPADLGQQTKVSEPVEDDIGFSDDEEDPAPATSTDAPHGSLRGKRSFEEHADDAEIDFNEPDQKKARAG